MPRTVALAYTASSGNVATARVSAASSVHCAAWGSRRRGRDVGWSVDTTLSTRLPLTALEAAIRKRRPDAGLLHHSDRGCQYTSDEYRAALCALDISVSMSRKGNCWDNAVAESFFSTLKLELIHRRTWRDVHDVRQAVFEYIEVFYNRRRLHSSLGYKPPALVEKEYAQAA